MAPLTKELSPSKVLMIGDSGSGKTGSLVSLVKAGYNVRLLDFDNGYEILYQLLKDDPEALARVDVESHTDPYEVGNASVDGKVVKSSICKTPTAFAAGMQVLDNWPGLGKITEWGPDTILVLDSLTMLGRSIMNFVLAANNKVGQQPSQPNWGSAMGLQEDVCARLYSSAIKCHVIVMAHVSYVQPEGELQQKGYPSALGAKLPPKIGRYFNSTLIVGLDGVGTAKTRTIFTSSRGLIEGKTPAPGIVKEKYPLATGLAEYFEALHGPLPK